MAVRLIIAEKPSVAKAIAEALSGGAPRMNNQGLYEVGSDLVAACAGHILEPYEPEDYDSNLKKWRIDDLPIIPEAWKLKPIPSNRKRLNQIKEAMKYADVIIQAGDKDAEGQRLVDEVIEYLDWKGPVLRAIFADLNPGPLRKAFGELKDNAEYALLSRRALARAQADWVLGMNCTRLYTKLAEKVGIRTVLSAGRVQSAVLGLVARREIEIKNFKPHDYFVMKLEVVHENGSFLATWKPNEDQVGLDPEGRLIEPSVVETLKSLAPGKAFILSADTKRKKQQAPIPFALSDLQKAANSRYGMTMARVLEVAQSLYDIHKVATYPRTDSGYLTEEQHSMAADTLAALASNLPDLKAAVEGADASLKSRAFNDAKVTAHHGIVPTALQSPDTISRLNKDERAIYEMIAERFVMQFYPPAEYDATRIEVGSPDGDGQRFIATGKVWIKQGWRSINAAIADEQEEGTDNDKEDSQALPKVLPQDPAEAAAVIVDKKKTKPPKPFTDSTLLTAMTNIHRYVASPAIKKQLKEGEGIGTEATRATIVEALIKRYLMRREKRYLYTSRIGMAHFSMMPVELTTPDMAGVFERDTRLIEMGKMGIDELLIRVEKFIRLQIESQEKWLEKARKHAPVEEPTKFTCRGCSDPLYNAKAVKKKRSLQYFRCKNDKCGCCFRSDNGAPTICFSGPLKEQDAKEAAERRNQLLQSAPTCGECMNPLMRRMKEVRGDDWHFWTCEAYQGKSGCDSIYHDANEAPGQIFVRKGTKVEREADGAACPECYKATFTGVTKAQQTPILICRECDSMYERNEDGSPGKARKVRGEWAKKPADGPACMECKESTREGMTKKSRKPILICDACDSMFWVSQKGQPQVAFKVRGQMVKRATH